MSGPLHSAVTDDWGTPSWLVEIGREVMGSIDLDVASHWLWNDRVVKAAAHCGEQLDGSFTDGLKAEWRGNVFCNPPGAPPKLADGKRQASLVVPFWRKLVSHCMLPGESGLWIGFSIEQLAMLQQVSCPLRFPTCVLAKRVRYLKKAAEGWAEGAQPPHGSYMTLLSRDRKVVKRFAKLLKGHGHLVGVEQ